MTTSDLRIRLDQYEAGTTSALELSPAECRELIELIDQQRRRIEELEPEIDYKAMIVRGGLDMSPCMKCGEIVACLPDGMPMCCECADEEEAKTARQHERK